MVQIDHHRTFTKLGNYLTDLVGNKLRNKQIADALQVSEAAVSNWFSGQRHPEQEHLLKLCGLLQTTFKDVERAFDLAGYYLSPEEIEQVNAWQNVDQQAHELQTFNDLKSWLRSIRGLKSGIELDEGLRNIKTLVKRIRQLIHEEGAKTRLLILYFDALDELTLFQNCLTSRELLRYVDLPWFLEMQNICEETKDSRLQARLLAAQGDEDYIMGSYRASYGKFKGIIDPTLVKPELYIRPILRCSCLDLSHPGVGSDTEFDHVTAKLHAAIDTYAHNINPMLIVLGLEGLSRAYTTRYQHTCKKEYKSQAIENFEAAETLANQSVGYPLYDLRVRKAKLQLARRGVLDGFSLFDLADLARDAKKLAEALGDSRSITEMDEFLRKIER